MNPVEAQHRFKQLPKTVQDMMASPDTASIIGQIGERHSLRDIQLAAIADEVGWVMLGVHPREQLAATLQDSIPVDTQTAGEIADELEQNIFSSIREEVDSTYHKFNPEETGGKTANQKSPSTSSEGNTAAATSQQPVSLVEQMRVYEERKKKQLEEERKNRDEKGQKPASAPPRGDMIQAAPPEKSTFPSNRSVPENLPTDEPKPDTGANADIKPPQEEAIPHHVETPSGPPPKKYPGNNDPYHEPIN